MFLLSFALYSLWSHIVSIFIHYTKKPNSSLLLHDSCSILCYSIALPFTSLSSFFLISHGSVPNYDCSQKNKKQTKKGKRMREEFPFSFIRMRWLIVTLLLKEQRKKSFSFQVSLFHLPLLSFNPSIE